MSRLGSRRTRSGGPDWTSLIKHDRAENRHALLLPCAWRRGVVAALLRPLVGNSQASLAASAPCAAQLRLRRLSPRDGDVYRPSTGDWGCGIRRLVACPAVLGARSRPGCAGDYDGDVFMDTAKYRARPQLYLRVTFREPWDGRGGRPADYNVDGVPTRRLFDLDRLLHIRGVGVSLVIASRFPVPLTTTATASPRSRCSSVAGAC